MGNALKVLKSDVHDAVSNIKDEETLKEVYDFLKSKALVDESQALIDQITQSGRKLSFIEGITTVRSNVSLEQLKKEQNYMPITYEEFTKKADEIDWGDVTLEEMLEAVK